MHLLCLRIILSISFFSICICFEKMLGPADFILHKLEKCSDVEQTGGIEMSFTQRKYNRTVHIIDIHLQTEYVLDDNLTIEYKGALKKEGGYKQGSILLKKPLCEGLHMTVGDVFIDYLNAAGFTDCPIPIGSYEVNNFYFDNSKFTVPQIYGDYNMEFNVWNENELLYCLDGYYELSPKHSK